MPIRLSRSTQAEPSTGASGREARNDVDGPWRMGSGSQAGYRGDEMLFEQNTTAVGRTEEITGELEIDGTRATSGTFTVDLASVKSDSDQRDSQFRGRIMNTERYPEATFELTDYGIDAPDFGGIAVEDEGTVEFLLAFTPA